MIFQIFNFFAWHLVVYLFRASITQFLLNLVKLISTFCVYIIETVDWISIETICIHNIAFDLQLYKQSCMILRASTSKYSNLMLAQ